MADWGAFLDGAKRRDGGRHVGQVLLSDFPRTSRRIGQFAVLDKRLVIQAAAGYVGLRTSGELASETGSASIAPKCGSYY